MNQATSSSATQTVLALADDLGAFSALAKRIQKKLVMLTPAKDGTYLKLVQDTLEAKQDFEEKRYTTFDTVDALISHLNSNTNS